MGLIRRVTLSIGTTVSLVAALTIAGTAAAGGFGLAPGHYIFSDSSANAGLFNPVDQTNWELSVDRQLFVQRLHGGGATPPQQMTVLSVFIVGPGVDPNGQPIEIASGCFVIPDSDFTIGSNLSTATLNATVDETNECDPSGSLVPFGTAGVQGVQGTSSFGFSFPLTVTGTWVGNGFASTSTDQGRFTCGGFASNTHSRTQSEISSSVTLSISGYGALSGSNFGFVSIANQVMDVKGSGILPPECGGKG